MSSYSIPSYPNKHRRLISPYGNIDLANTLFAWLLRECTVCHKVKPPEEKGTFKRCSRCKCVVYCSVECQQKDWKRCHKDSCKKIISTLTLVKKHAAELIQFNEEERRINENRPRRERAREQAFDPLNIYEADVVDKPFCTDDRPFCTAAGGNYMQARRTLLQVLGDASFAISIAAKKQYGDPHPFKHYSALMLEHSLDLLEIMKLWNAHGHSCPAFFKTFSVLDTVYDEHSKMYSLGKYFCRKGTKNTSIFVDADDENGPLELIGAPCWDQNDDIGESTEALDLSHLFPNVEALFNIYRLKFWLYEMTRGLRILNECCLDYTLDCTSLIGEYLGIRSYWWQVPGGARVYLGQAREILSALNRYDRPHLLHIQGRLPSMITRSDWCGSTYFDYFLNHTEREILPIPRNAALETRRLDLIMKRGRILLQNHYHRYLSEFETRDQYNLEIERKDINDILDEYRHVLENSDKMSRERGYCVMGLKIEEAFARAHFHRKKHSSHIKSLFDTMGLDSAEIWPEDYGNSSTLSQRDDWDIRLLNATHPDIVKIVDALRRYNLMNRENLMMCFGTSALFVDYYSSI